MLNQETNVGFLKSESVAPEMLSVAIQGEKLLCIDIKNKQRYPFYRRHDCQLNRRNQLKCIGNNDFSYNTGYKSLKIVHTCIILLCISVFMYCFMHICVCQFIYLPVVGNTVKNRSYCYYSNKMNHMETDLAYGKVYLEEMERRLLINQVLYLLRRVNSLVLPRCYGLNKIWLPGHVDRQSSSPAICC